MSRARDRERNLFVATWNVRSLVEDSGDERICRKNKNAQQFGVDRKLDFLVDELSKFNVAVAGIQETKWFGADVWPIGRRVFLHSGRPLPSGGEPARRNEGVGLVLNEEMTKMWRRGGEQWTAINSRIISARILVAEKGSKLPGGGRRHSDFFMSIINVYAPTSKAPFSQRSSFYEALQRVVDSVDRRDILCVLGDFKARVGSSDGLLADREQVWGSTLGPFGVGSCIGAGEDLLSFSARNQISIMNTWFRKSQVVVARGSIQLHMSVT